MREKDSPLPRLLSFYQKLKDKIAGKPKNIEELLRMIRGAQGDAIIDAESLRMIEGVIQISDMPVEEIMISRAEMIVVQKDMSIEEILGIVIESAHSRIPVIGDNKDEVIGILLAKDLLPYAINEPKQRFAIKDVLRTCLFIPESKRLGILLNAFRKDRNHLAIVVDEFGGVSGLVTIEDVLEQIVGEIEDEHDIEQGIYIRLHKDNHYSVKALTPIEEFNHFFGTTLSDAEFDTIGGLVLQGFGHLPKRGETISIDGIPFTVTRANNRRIQILQTTLTPLKKTEE